MAEALSAIQRHEKIFMFKDLNSLGKPLGRCARWLHRMAAQASTISSLGDSAKTCTVAKAGQEQLRENLQLPCCVCIWHAFQTTCEPLLPVSCH